MGEAPVSTEQPQAGQAPRIPAPHVDPSGASDPGRPPAQGPQPPVGLTAPVRDRATFHALQRSRQRARRGSVSVAWVPPPAGRPESRFDEPVRVAYAVGRRAGGAVTRNRIRRRLRAAVRQVRPDLVPGAYLIGAGAAAGSQPFGELCELLRSAAGAAAVPRSSVRAGT